jgi:hypothetical protein
VSERVCPFCGEPPGPGVFCAACGRNLAGVERLPTAQGWRGGVESVDAFIEAMHAAGDPGAIEIPVAERPAFRRPRKVSGWIVRDVDREDFAEEHRYEPGLLLSVEGRFHQLESELRGWGQRDFPRYEQSVSTEPVEPAFDARLGEELAAVAAAYGVGV